MTISGLRGVIAAAPTPIDAGLQPDLSRFVALCGWLLAKGCDGLNICGTTGEATSLTVEQRMRVMRAAASALPLAQLMAGTGAASIGDAVALTKDAEALGFAGALLLPPFYYKGVSDDGVIRYLDRIVSETASIDLYLYNFPALSGIEYSLPMVERLLGAFGERIVGLKDSSGNLDYAASIAALSPRFLVFPGNEAVLLKARAGAFAGCISASANVNSEFCSHAFHDGDEEALAKAIAIRAFVSKNPLVPSVKAVLASLMEDSAFENVLPPLMKLSEGDRRDLLSQVLPLLT
jgi:4-hydroxy-tetrahydrodipicolinate synthase